MTPRIAVLPGDIINKIAAGEVVERPASVVKELVENAIDAGATRVSVDVEQAGRRSIRVTDDGQGMTPEEAALAFQRHATSKIRTEADLSTIQSMGFRGEALPSIAAVSKVRLVTVAAGSSMGTEIRLEGGGSLAQRETAAAPGTTVEVTDLFYNTPARKKFLKSPATELGHVCQAVQRQALAFPEIHFRLAHNGHAVADYPAVPTLRDRVQQVYGTQLVDVCVDLQEGAGRFRLEGLCTRPLETALTKTPQDLFVNRRWVKNATIVHALYEGYGTTLARGHQPRFVLSLWVDPQQVDVNVHPTKREVRFADQEQVHEWVRSRIQASVRPASVASRTTVVSAWSPPQRSGHPVATDGFRDVSGYPSPAPDVPAGRQPRLQGVAELGQAYLPAVDQEEVRPLGQIANRYLVAQVGDEVQIVDQHTAHERVLFERLQRQLEAGEIASQRALLPQVVELSAAEVVSVRAHLEDLGRLGFEVEEFGQGSFVVRAMPALFGQGDPLALLRALVEDWDAWPSTPSLQERYNTVLASVACHSAVRAGRALEVPEMRRLLEDWREEGLPSTCPHGRRVAMRLTIEELDRIFGRLGWTE
jgi:DNA mismatch repair protein MutL